MNICLFSSKKNRLHLPPFLLLMQHPEIVHFFSFQTRAGNDIHMSSFYVIGYHLKLKMYDKKDWLPNMSSQSFLSGFSRAITFCIQGFGKDLFLLQSFPKHRAGFVE